jgi:anti-sigma regulatory factor (Ser/Thr protein kinase)
VSRWLSGLGCDRDDIDDLVLAVSEAVSNVVDHAYPSGDGGAGLTVETAILSDGIAHRVVITVADQGRWRIPPEINGYRGRGLLMMRELSETLELEQETTGTTVRITSRPCAAPDFVAATQPTA